MAQTICLSMIVKDEASVIKRCLDSVRGLITHWAIVDTGSTDDTIEIIQRELADLPGSVIQRPWVSFCENRNQALELARSTGADFVLTIDADEELVWPEGKELPELDGDIYGIRFYADAGEHTWSRSFILRAAYPWKWSGALHEFIDVGTNDPIRTLITGVHVVSHTDGARGKTDKYASDVDVLRKALNADPTDCRNWFYIAQSYSGMRNIEKAIECYEKRAVMGGWDEEVYMSLFQIAALKEARGDNWHEVCRAYLTAYNYRPSRAEPLYLLSVLHNDRNEPAIAEMYARQACRLPRPPDCLLVHETVYEYRAADEWAAALGRLGRNAEALEILKRLVAIPKLPEEERKRAEENIEFLST